MQDLPAPRWAPDPFRRHELRYWDGQRWTEHVSDEQVVTADPPVGPAVPRARRDADDEFVAADLWDDLESAAAPRGRRAARERGPVAESAGRSPGRVPAQHPPAGSTPAPTPGRTLSDVQTAGTSYDPDDGTPRIVRLSRESLLPEIAAALFVVVLVAGAALIARSNNTQQADAVSVAAVPSISADADAAASGSPTRKKKVSGPKISKPPKRVVIQAPAPTARPSTSSTTRSSTPTTTRTTAKPTPTQTSSSPSDEPTDTPSSSSKPPDPTPTPTGSSTPSPSDG